MFQWIFFHKRLKKNKQMKHKTTKSKQIAHLKLNSFFIVRPKHAILVPEFVGAYRRLRS